MNDAEEVQSLLARGVIIKGIIADCRAKNIPMTTPRQRYRIKTQLRPKQSRLNLL